MKSTNNCEHMHFKWKHSYYQNCKKSWWLHSFLRFLYPAKFDLLGLVVMQTRTWNCFTNLISLLRSKGGPQDVNLLSWVITSMCPSISLLRSKGGPQDVNLLLWVITSMSRYPSICLFLGGIQGWIPFHHHCYWSHAPSFTFSVNTSTKSITRTLGWALALAWLYIEPSSQPNKFIYRLPLEINSKLWTYHSCKMIGRWASR